ncbi:hypothetical protein ACI65C_008776 [Semiaphis heraclei]
MLEVSKRRYNFHMAWRGLKKLFWENILKVFSPSIARELKAVKELKKLLMNDDNSSIKDSIGLTLPFKKLKKKGKQETSEEESDDESNEDSDEESDENLNKNSKKRKTNKKKGETDEDDDDSDSDEEDTKKNNKINLDDLFQ